MKKLNKYVRVGIVLCLAAVLLITSLWGSGDVQAAPSRMSGVQKVVNSISETDPFTIVEIVPDNADATLGFLVKGYEPKVPGGLLKTVKGEAARKEVATKWLSEHTNGTASNGQMMISFVSSSLYEEQLHKPADASNWTILYFTEGYSETRTGSFKEAVDYGLEMKQSHTWNRFGEGRRLKIVETVDEKLVELAQEILDEEKETIDLLDKIGEVKGLLINLYM